MIQIASSKTSFAVWQEELMGFCLARVRQGNILASELSRAASFLRIDIQYSSWRAFRHSGDKISRHKAVDVERCIRVALAARDDTSSTVDEVVEEIEAQGAQIRAILSGQGDFLAALSAA